ncbi:MAG: glycosyltransferase family 39 protein [Vicinamibacteraceae bacterium]|nr:glycosyltransferase family 39 protein [Vicinamibacteraceae bacterium]
MPDALHSSAERVPGPSRLPGWGLLVVLLIAGYALPLAVPLPLLDPDEGFHATIAEEMARTGDWVTPRWLGEPFLDKPILFFWSQAASVALFGATERAIRLPGLLFAVAGVLTTAWLAAVVLDRRVAALAGAFYATMALPLGLAQAAVHDIALVPWANLALGCLWLSVVPRSGKAPPTARALALSAAAGVALGLTILTKGLTGVALVGLPFALFLLWQRHLTWLAVAAGLVSLVVAAFVAAPWYLAMERVSPGYLHYFFVERHLLGYATGSQMHGWRPWWYYLPILLAGGLPWITSLWRGTTTGAVARAGVRLAWVWLVVDVAFLSAAGSKLSTYLLPVFPAVALLAASAWAARADGDLPARWRDPIPWTAAFMAATMVAGPWAAARHLGLAPPLVPVLVAVLLAVCWLALAAAWKRTTARRWLGGALGVMGLTTAGLLAVIAPAFAPFYSARDAARYLNAREALPAEVWVFNERVGSLVFYLSPALRQDVTRARVRPVTPALVFSMRQAPDDTLVLVPVERLPAMRRLAEVDAVPYDEAGTYRAYTAASLVEARDRRLRQGSPEP